MAVGGGRAHHQVTFAVLSLGVAAFALLQSLVVPVLTTVQHELHTTQSAATWVLTAYLLSASIMTPILGRIGDMIGKERVFVATLVALAAGSLLAAVASSIGVLIGARVIQGIGGGMLPVAFGIGGSIGSAVMASIVTSQLGPSGLPKQAGYTTGFAVMAGGLVLAALAGLLIPSARRLRPTAGEPDYSEIATVAGGRVVGGNSK